MDSWHKIVLQLQANMVALDVDLARARKLNRKLEADLHEAEEKGRDLVIFPNSHVL